MLQILRIVTTLGSRFLAPLLGVGVVLFWYFWYAGGGSAGPLLLDEYCYSLRPGTPVEDARKAAEDQGFRIIVEEEGSFSAMVSVMMYQRRICEVSSTDGRVTGSRSYTVD